MNITTEIKPRRFIRDLMKQHRKNEESGKHYMHILILGETLPGGLDPKQVIKYLPEGWEMKQYTPDDYPPEAREIREINFSLFSTVFRPPESTNTNLV